MTSNLWLKVKLIDTEYFENVLSGGFCILQ